MVSVRHGSDELKNREIAQIFDNMADILELRGGDRFRINSYRKTARVLNDLTSDIQEVADQGKLQTIAGIGVATAEKISEYLRTGRITRYEELRRGLPDGLLELLSITGLGPKTVGALHQKLGVKSLAELQKILDSDKILELPGVGPKKVENIRRGIQIFRARAERIPLGVALVTARGVVEKMRKMPGVEAADAAGSLRRMRETIGDIDILVKGSNGRKIVDSFVHLPEVKEVLAAGETKGSVRVEGNLQIDVRVVEPGSYGAALQYFTGSKSHNIRCRELGKRKGLKLNEYGVFRGERQVAGKTEEEVYKAIGLPWIDPELREDRGEIEAALDGKLPVLVTLDKVRGDVHWHSEWTDGTGSVADVAEAARKRGYQWVAITDHSRAVRVAGGLGPDELRKRNREIAALNERLRGFRVFAAAEVDILGDGAMDFQDDLLEELDLVVAAIHSGFGQPSEQITRRIVSACRNPHVDIIAHPTGRLLGKRPPYEVHLESVIRVAAETGTALEINAYEDRLDLDDIWARKAKDSGVKLAIGTDTHHPEQAWMMELGVAVARRAWLESTDLLNTMTASDLLKWCSRTRRG